jgi:hypothetical protein
MQQSPERALCEIICLLVSFIVDEPNPTLGRVLNSESGTSSTAVKGGVVCCCVIIGLSWPVFRPRVILQFVATGERTSTVGRKHIVS